MKKPVILFLVFCWLNPLISQVTFTKVTEGPVVTATSDSRSVNFVDIDNDGWDDLFISNGPENGQNNMLYINDQEGGFTVFSGDAIVQDNSPSDGATFADVDNDGDLDAFVVTWHGDINYYYQNNGNGSFSYLSDKLTASTGTHSETASWGDYDQDGLVDLFITNSYVNLKNMLFKNLGDQNFTQITSGSPVSDNTPSRSVQWVDYDGDGLQDLFVSNESNRKNNLFHNDGDGTFTKIEEGPIVQTSKGSMSGSWADVNNDGYLDLFVANAGYFQQQNNQLFINQGDGTFVEQTTSEVATQGGCSYGSAFADIDNDGDEDLLVANGYCNINLRDYLYLNDGNGNFTRDETILSALPNTCSFGCAWSDFNKDGFLDLAVAQCQNSTNASQPVNTLFTNDGNENNWVQIKLEGTLSNRSAIGAIIRIKANINGNSVWQMRQLSAQSGYCGQNSLIAHFGLKDAATIDSILVEWPSGIKNVLTDQSINQQLFILEEPNTAVPNQLLSNFTIDLYPNPTQGQIQLKVEGLSGQTLEISIIDSLGRIPFTRAINTSGQPIFSFDLDLQKNLQTPGIYYLYLKNGKNVGVRSFSFTR